MSKPSITHNTAAAALRAEISELRQQLKSRRIENHALIDSLDEGLVVIGPQGMVRQVNAYALRSLGLGEDQIIGQRFTRVLVTVNDNGHEIDPLSRPMAEAFIEGKPVSEYTNLRRQDGTSLPVLLTASPIIIDGKPAGAIDVFRDLTKERQLDLAKNDFVSLASHQLRTPASGVKAILNMLQQGDFGPLSKLQRQYLQRAIDSNDRQLRIVEDLLDVARADSGILNLSMDYVDLAALVRTVAYEHQAGATAKQQNLEVVAPTQAFAVADGPKLAMAIDNLISNAIKYTPAGGQIRVTLKQRPQELTVNVWDNGIGIANEHLPIIFSKFGRIDSALSSKGDSTGLGLYLAKQVINLHNGDISVKSQPGKGSDFCVRLPAQQKLRYDL